MPQVLAPEEIVPRLLSRLDRTNRRWIVGLAGLPGAGKSTLAAHWINEVNELNARACCLGALPAAMALGMDGFHFSRAQLGARPDANEALARRGAPWTFDALALAARLRALRASSGEPIGWPGFKHEVGDPQENAISIPHSARLILVEGLYLLHHEDGWREVSDLLDERWFLDTPFETAMARLLARHMQAWDLSREQARQRIGANDGLNARIVQASRAHADFCVAQ